MNMLMIVTLIIVVATSIWVFFDATSLGIKRTGNKSEAKTGAISADMGPGGWFACCLFFWVVSFPMYLTKRAKHLSQIKTVGLKGDADLNTNCPSCGSPLTVSSQLFGQIIECPSCKHQFQAPHLLHTPSNQETVPAAIGWAVYVVLLSCTAYVFLSGQQQKMSTEQLEAHVKDQIADKLRIAPKTRDIQIQSFGLVHQQGNEYKGLLNVRNGIVTETLNVDVTYDGRQFMWQIVPSTPSQTEPPEATQTTESEVAQPQRAEPQAKLIIKPAPFDPDNPQWNNTDIDAVKNGNIRIAAKLILATGRFKRPRLDTGASAASVAKAPWDYYGKIAKLTGQVAVVQDFPPGSDLAQGLGSKDVSDIVLEAEDGTIVEMFCMKSSETISVGSKVTLYGFPCGVTEVPNRLGGNDTHLILVGNKYDIWR
jgi:hypothetical protein